MFDFIFKSHREKISELEREIRELKSNQDEEKSTGRFKDNKTTKVSKTKMLTSTRRNVIADCFGGDVYGRPECYRITKNYGETPYVTVSHSRCSGSLKVRPSDWKALKKEINKFVD